MAHLFDSGNCQTPLLTRWRCRTRRPCRRSAAARTSPGGFVILSCGSSVTAREIESRADVVGARRAHGSQAGIINS